MAQGTGAPSTLNTLNNSYRILQTITSTLPCYLTCREASKELLFLSNPASLDYNHIFVIFIKEGNNTIICTFKWVTTV